MKLKAGTLAVFLLVIACVFAAVPASANVVNYVAYDNTGPDSYTTNAWSIFDVGGGAYTVTDSFKMSQFGWVDGANFYVWVYPGDSLSSVTWSISSTAFGAPLATGTATGAPNFQVGTAFGYYPVLEESITIPYLGLAAGTYWFQLSDALDAYDINVWWDQSSGHSTAYETGGYGQVHSETFQIIAATPEPSNFLLLGLGVLVLAALATRNRLLA